MAKQLVNFFQNTKGISTDASPFLQPEGTFSEMSNYVPDIDGRLACRKGLIEESGSYGSYTQVVPVDDKKFATYYWTNAYNNNSFIVVRAGNELYLYRDTSNALRNEQDYYFKVDLLKYKTVASGSVSTSVVSVAPTNGALYVCGEYVRPFYIRAYDDGSFEEIGLEIYEREFNGFRDDYEDRSTRPTVLTEDLLYSLHNRGWTAEHIKAFFDETTTVYPSLTDNPEYGYYENPSNGNEQWRAKQVTSENTGFCPEGHVVRRAFDYGEAAVIYTDAGVDSKEVKEFFYDKYADLGSFADALAATRAAYPVTAATGTVNTSGNPIRNLIEQSKYNGTSNSLIGRFLRATTKTSAPSASPLVVDGSDTAIEVFGSHVMPSFSTNASYAGRIWWAGSRESVNSSKLYYSQTLDEFGKAGACHSEADPTSRKTSEVIDSDGGVISINDIGAVQKLFPFGNSLVVFATNGIWQVSGRDGIFTATDYFQSKIGNHVLVGNEAVCEIGGAVFFWATSGLFVLSSEGNQVVLKSISDGVCSKLLNSISTANKRNAQTAYDKTNKIIYVVYGDNDVLCVDFRLGAVYKLHTDSDILFKAVCLHEFVADQNERIKFFSIRNIDGSDRYVWTSFASTGYTDVTSTDPVEVECYATTAFVAGDGVRRKNAQYAHILMDNIEDTSTDVRIKLNYTTDEAASKWSSWQGAFGSADPDTAIAKRKVRLPGMGHSFAIEFYSKGKPSSLVGWAIELEVVDNT